MIDMNQVQIQQAAPTSVDGGGGGGIGDGGFFCPTCGREFDSQKELNTHTASAHGGGGGDGGGGGGDGGGGGGDTVWDISGWQAPSWWPSSAYTWTDWGEQASPNVKQTWYRSPQWGGHVVYHPYWGWQDYMDVLGKYEEGGPYNYEDFQKWGFTQQLEPDWKKYFPDRIDGGDGGGDGNWTFGDTDWGTQTYPDFYGDISSYYPYYGQYTPFENYPPEWDTASNTLQSMAAGEEPYIPKIWGQLWEHMQPFSKTGMPVTEDAWYKAAKATPETDFTDAIRQAAEQAGMGGTRWSSTLGRTAQDIAGRQMAQLGTERESKAMTALENARARQTGMLPYYYQMGQGVSDIINRQDDRALQAAGMLGNLGSMYANLPLQFAQQAMNMGGQMTGQTQNMISPYYQEFLRRTPEASPWLQLMLGMIPGGTQMAPTQYQQGGMSQFLGGFSSLLPLLFLL